MKCWLCKPYGLRAEMWTLCTVRDPSAEREAYATRWARGYNAVLLFSRSEILRATRERFQHVAPPQGSKSSQPSTP